MSSPTRKEIMSSPTSPLGNPTSSAFGPQSAFGQANNANNSPSVGGTTPFGSPTGGSVYGRTSTGVSGGGSSQTRPLMPSGAPFGDSSSSAFVAPFGSPTGGGSVHGGTSTGVSRGGFPQTHSVMSPFGNSSSPVFVGGSVYGGTSTGVSGGGSSQTHPLMPSRAPFGDSSSSAFVAPFGSPTGGSVHGGTSTGVSSGGFPQTHSVMSPFGNSSSPVFVGKTTSIIFVRFFAFGQANNANNNPSVGGTTPFGSPTVGSVYGRTSTGLSRGAFPQNPSLMSSRAAFGNSSSPAFGGKTTSIIFVPFFAFEQTNNANNNPFVGGTTPFGSQPGGPVFGGTSTGVFRGGFLQAPLIFSAGAAFGNSSSPAFDGSSPFGQNPAFRHFVFTPTQTSTSGTSHPSQPAFGSRIFCSSTPFGAQSRSLFSASSTPGYGWSTPAYGTISTPACVTDSAPSFGATSTPAYGSTMNAAFGTGGIAFGAMQAPIFWSRGAFGSSSNPAFGPSTTAFRNNQYGSESHEARIGPQVATPTFGNTEFGESSFGGQHRGIRVAPFTPTTEAETGVMPLAKLQSICGMTVPVNKYKSHEELRWVDYQWGDKGGPNHAGQSGVSVGHDGVPKDGPLEEQTDFVKASKKLKGVHDDSSLQNDEGYVIIKGADESAIGYDCGAGIETLMPKLCQPDYYTEPHVKELAAKERAEPGFCCRVKDFVVGRIDYGHIKFVGETDVRRLNLESLVRFNNRELIVYTDESKKPPIGQGLNKAAEVTLLNIKCIEKKTGKQYIEGPKVEKYKEMLKKAAEEQGAEFVSYDPIKGEWKFKVHHFS